MKLLRTDREVNILSSLVFIR